MPEPNSVGCIGHTIPLKGGRYFDLTAPTVENIDIWDIARGLGNTCRFAGQCKFYSVAEHSYVCYQIARLVEPTDTRLHYHAAMHDAAEAYVGDVPKPLKLLLPRYSEIEATIEAVIRKKYGLSDQYDERVKFIDLCALKTEQLQLFPHEKRQWSGLKDYPAFDIEIEHWNPGKATRAFWALAKAAYEETL